MNIYEIEKLNLSGKNFAFKTTSGFHEVDFKDHLFVFDGLPLILCVKGTSTITIDYKEYPLKIRSL